MNNKEDIFGQDFLLDENFKAQTNPQGELKLANGEQAAIQDISLRIFTRLGSLFYDQEFGSLIPDFIHDENTQENRLSFRAEVKLRVEMDARVLAGSADCKILKWDEKEILAEVSWFFWDSKQPQNLSLTLKRPLAAKIKKDLNYAVS